ncbi:MAG: MFS transporter [Ktedonobacteraceae bacterium]
MLNQLLALGLLPLLAVHSRESLWIVFVVQFVESCIAQFVQPAESALLPNLVSEEQLVSANALTSVSTNTARLAGAALGGLLVGVVGLAGVTLLDAISFLFVSAMIWLIRMPAVPEPASEAVTPDAAQASAGHLGREWLEGIHLIARSRMLSVILIIFAAMGLGEGVFGVLLIVFVKKVLGGGAIEYGLLLSVQAIGSLVGGLVIAQVGSRIAPARLFGMCLVAFGFIDLLIVNVPAFIPGLLIVLVLFVIVGLPATGMMVSLNALLQISVDDRLRGRVFGTSFAVYGLMVLIGMILAGVLGDRLGPVLLLNIQGGIHVLAGIFALLMLGAVKAREHQEQDKAETRALSPN